MSVSAGVMHLSIADVPSGLWQDWASVELIDIPHFAVMPGLNVARLEHDSGGAELGNLR